MRITGLSKVVAFALLLSLLEGGHTTWAVEKNISSCTADGSCNRQGAEPPGNLTDMSKMNYLNDQSNCNGILNDNDKKSVVNDIMKINEDYLSGKTDLQERGQLCSKTIEEMIQKNHLTGDEAKAARAWAVGAGAAVSTAATEATALEAAKYAKAHGGKILPAYAQALAREGKAGDIKKYVIDTAKPYGSFLDSLSSVGIKTNDKGVTDFTGMKVTAKQINGDPKLKTALGLFVGRQQAEMLSDSNRTTVLPGGSVVFLPPKKDGSIPVLTIDKYNEEVSRALNYIKNAIGPLLSYSQAATTTGRELQRLGGFGNHELAERADIWNGLQNAASNLKTLGVSGQGLDQISSSLAQARSAMDSDDQKGKEKLKAIEKAVIITAGGAGAGKILSWWANGEEAGGIAELRNLATAANKTDHVMESMSNSVEGVASLQKVVREAMATATIDNMAPMAMMPFTFSTATSVINAAIDKANHNGNFFCRMSSDMTEKFAGNLMMANFAWSAPVATFVGSGLEAVGIVKNGTATAGAINGIVGAGFTWQAGKAAGPGLKNCGEQILNGSGEGWGETTKTCVAAGMDTAFLITGTMEMGSHAIHSGDIMAQARVDAQTNFDQKTADREAAQQNIDAANDRAKTGNLREGDKFRDGDGNTYRVVQSLEQDGKGVIVGVNEKTGQAVSVASDRLAGGKGNMSFKVENEKLAKAQARYNALGTDVAIETSIKTNDANAPAPRDVAAVQPEDATRSVATDPAKTDDTFANDEETTRRKPSSKIAALQIKVALKMDGLWTKAKDQFHSATKNKFNKTRAAAEDNISMELIIKDLSDADLVKLDKKLETQKGQEEVVKTLEDADGNCLEAKNDTNQWDPEGNFIGILYAQNDASCWL